MAFHISVGFSLHCLRHEHFRRAVEAHPSNSNALFQLGLCALELGPLEDAVELMNKSCLALWDTFELEIQIFTILYQPLPACYEAYSWIPILELLMWISEMICLKILLMFSASAPGREILLSGLEDNPLPTSIFWGIWEWRTCDKRRIQRILTKHRTSWGLYLKSQFIMGFTGNCHTHCLEFHGESPYLQNDYRRTGWSPTKLQSHDFNATILPTWWAFRCTDEDMLRTYISEHWRFQKLAWCVTQHRHNATIILETWRSSKLDGWSEPRNLFSDSVEKLKTRYPFHEFLKDLGHLQ